MLSIYTTRFAPRSVMLAVMGLFILSQVLCVLAPDYTLLLAARLVGACGHGVFFGVGSVIVSRLVPMERRGRAFSLFVGGITVANLLGLPGGTFIGNTFGWRATFAAVAVCGLLAMVALAMKLPRVTAEEHGNASIRQQFRALRHQQVWMSYLIIMTVMIGNLTFGTYQVAMLLDVTKVEPLMTPFYLLLGGVGSIFGIWLGGRLTDWKAMPSLIAILVCQAMSFATFLFTMPHPVLMAINLFVGGAIGFAFSTPLQARVIAAAHEAPNLASSLISTAFNVGIAAGAFLGAVLLTAGVSYAQLPAVGVVVSLIAAGLATLSYALERRALPLTA